MMADGASEHADDANRRLIDQALFKTIYNDVRVGCRNPYDGPASPASMPTH